jgi:hypothetical protein
LSQWLIAILIETYEARLNQQPADKDRFGEMMLLV